MSYKVKMTSQAKKDMSSIYRYIALQLKEPQIAAKQYERIKSEIQKLNEMPERHAYYPDEPWRSYGVRKLIVDNYIGIYLIDSKAKMVIVMRVMYAGRDIFTQLKDSKLE
jgi:toxin ParE1/3/4